MPTLAQVGIADMRRSGSWSYIDSYARNEAPPTGRRIGNNSAQYVRAGLQMGRYVQGAFTSTNPDYASELSYLSPSDPIVTATYGRGLYWNQVYCADPWGTSHTTGWINNTRVMCWGFQFWIKSKSTGQWTLRTSTDAMSGEAWSPNFTVYGGQQNAIDIRNEPSTGYPSVRLVYDSSEPTGAGYWIWHGYAGSIFTVDPADVADVICLQKASLVVHDSFYADDRGYARFVLAMGGDWYPVSGSLAYYPGIGTSRHKLVTAKWPAWQYHVMHTMTEAQWNAVGGYPAVFDTLAEGSDTSTGGGTGGNEATPQPLVPSRVSWFTKLVGGTDNAWTTHSAVGAVNPLGAVPIITRSNRRRRR